MTSQKCVFKDFIEYWHYVRNLSKEQRNTIFNSLSSEHQKLLTKLYADGGWEDLFMRDTLDKILDSVNERFGVDLISIRIKVLKGKNYEIDKKKWSAIINIFDNYDDKHIRYIFGGIEAEVVNETNVLLKRDPTFV